MEDIWIRRGLTGEKINCEDGAECSKQGESLKGEEIKAEEISLDDRDSWEGGNTMLPPSHVSHVPETAVEIQKTNRANLLKL